MSSFHLSRATLEALELPSLLALVAARAATDLGRRALLELSPFADEEELRAHRRRYEEARRLVAARPLVPAFEHPLAPLLGELERGGYGLGGRELVAIGDFLAAGAAALERIRDADPPCAALAERIAEVPAAAELCRELERVFDRRGEIREHATPLLAELRGRIRHARSQLYAELGRHVESQREHLSEETIPLRDGRLVLVLQAGARGKVEGLIHGRSASGRSFYYEPFAAVDLNNRLQESIAEEEAEKRRLLAELVARLRRELPTIRAHARLTTDLDRLQASVRFAQAADARLADLGGRHQWSLAAARHPLLDPRLAPLRQEALGQAGHQAEIVPLDLELDAERRALVVTGPNAGGKTVALKTAGILALAHQCGLPIPAAAGSRLPFLAALVATVGDDQDLLADRSTFSGRLLRLREAWDAAGPDALILLDELGSGTDPEEGSALAIALLEGLLERRSLVFVTTHLTQLAAAALEAEGAVCAAMEFDAAGAGPTYRLRPGPPGGSEALALARRLGLPGRWLDRAEQLLGSEHRDLRRLLAEVEKARRELAATQALLDVELSDAGRLRERLAGQEKALAAERQRLGKELKKDLEAFKDRARGQLRDELARLRRELEAGRRKGLVAAAAERLFAAAPELAPASGEEEAEPVVGGRVRHRGLGWEGRLEKLDRGRAQVRVDGKVFRCRQEDLVGLAAGPGPQPRRPPARGPAVSLAAPEEETPRELNLIGRRVEPALDELERFLDQALLAAYREVRVVHGHGSGRLRAAVRERLRGHPAVARHQPGRPEEGGDGATVVHLQVG